MSARTKIFLAVVTLLVGVLAVYYGVMLRGADPALDTGNRQQARSDDGGPAGRAAVDPLKKGSSQQPPTAKTPGLLSESLQRVAAVSERAPGAPQGAATGGVRPRPAAKTPGVRPVQTPSMAGERVAARPASGSRGRPAGARDGARNPVLKSAEPTKYVPYVVKRGDTLTSIARDWFGNAIKWDLIAEANPFIDPGRLDVGQELRLPPKGAKRTDPKQRGSSGRNRYTVHSGDSLSKIAKSYYGDPDRWWVIYDANRATIGDDPDGLRVGMTLRIPAVP